MKRDVLFALAALASGLVVVLIILALAGESL